MISTIGNSVNLPTHGTVGHLPAHSSRHWTLRGAALGSVASLCAMALWLCAFSAQAGMADRAVRQRVAGLDLIVYPTPVKDVVTIRGALPAGKVFAARGNPAVPVLTGMMLERGTQQLDKYAIAQQLEDMGADVAFAVGDQALTVEARCLRQDLRRVIRLIAEQLRMPAFGAEEFERARRELVGALRSQLEDTEFRAEDSFARAVFPPGHPNHPHDPQALIAAAQRATLDQIKAFHRRHYGPAHMTLVLVGDVTVADAHREVAAVFAGWSGGVNYVRSVIDPTPVARREDVFLAEKTSVSVRFGQATGLRYRDADALALRVGTAILGGDIVGRLMANVRGKQGLTYGVHARMGRDDFADGNWSIRATFAPQLLARGIEATQAELNKWWREGVTEEELSRRQQNLVAAFQIELSTTEGIAEALLQAAQRGYGVDWLDAYPAAIKALTRSQVNAAIRKHLDPKKMSLIRAGTLSEPHP